MPSVAAKHVLRLDFPAQVSLQISAVAAAVGSIMAIVYFKLRPDIELGVFASFFNTPLLFFFMQIANTIITTLMVYHFGRVFGGTGNFRQSFALMATIAAVGTFLQALQYLLMFVIPPLAQILSLFSFYWLFWAMTSFITEVHEFQSKAKVFGGIILTILGLAVLLGVLSVMLGIVPQGPV